MKPFIIVDVGSNQRGSLDLALKHIDAAKACGADAVKYQLFTGKELHGFENPEVDRHSIHHDWLLPLSNRCRETGVEFMCTAFSSEGVRTVDKYVSRHKIASAEMKDTEILDAVARTGKPFIVSTGGAHHMEIDWLHDSCPPSAILECVALYPAEPQHYNLRVLQEWAFKYPTVPACGISDHTIGDIVAVSAVGFGATIFEKHFDCEKDSCLLGPTPDSPVSIGPAAMSHYVQSIHTAMSAIGDGVKRPAHQHEMALKWRRRLIATVDLEPGDTLQRGVNFGSYRSLKDDTRAAASERIAEFDGRRVVAAVKAGDGIWEADIE